MTDEIILTQQEYDNLISICTSNRDKYSKLVKKYKELQTTAETYKQEADKFKDLEKSFEYLRHENEKLRKQSEEVVCLYAELDKARNRIKELENLLHENSCSKSSQPMSGGNNSNVITTPAKKTAVKDMFSYL